MEDTKFLSEESDNVDWNERKHWKRYWLVDPLDGIKEFVNKNGEFTINIALIDNHSPILGVIYAPTTNLIYLGSKGLGAFSKKINTQEDNLTLKDDCKLVIDKLKKKETINIVSSRSHRDNDKMNNWLKSQKKYQIQYSGSSIKFCMISEGKADIYPRFQPTSEWDIAAGHCILKEAGGNIKTLEGNEIQYNKKESLINPDFIASND